MQCRRTNQRGAVAVWLLVIMVPVLLGMIGFALDLGILYSVKGELKTGANAMALAAAQQLIGTDASATAAQAAALQTVDNATGFGNKYYFHGFQIGQNNGSLTSVISDPGYYASAADAIASATAVGSEVPPAQAKYVRFTITGQTPLVFWSLLPTSGDHTVQILSTAVAGVSAPLCLACGIEPFGVAAQNLADTTDFGFVPGVKYSFFYSCTGGPGTTPPGILAGATVQLAYVLINRLDPNATLFPDETAQAFRDLAGGLPGDSNTGQSCFRVNGVESLWLDAPVNRCGTAQTAVVTAALCGLDARFESTPQAACSNIPGLDTLSTIYQPDTDIDDHDIYTDYTGAGRRVITIPIVDTTGATASMTVLGFRQFLLSPTQGATDINPADRFGRFVAMYIGSVKPVPQGRFDGCTQTAGPGKVILHQ